MRHLPLPRQVRLALELLASMPVEISRLFEVRVLADSSFELSASVQGVRDLSFEFVVGVRATRRADHPGQVTVATCDHCNLLPGAGVAR